MARKESIFTMRVDSDDAIKDIKKLDQDMTHLAQTIGVEVSGSISAMEDKLYEMALAGDTTSKEFIQLQKQTAKYKQVIIETDRSIDALAEQGRGLSTALSLAEGTVAGFQAFTGVTALMGSENEELLSTITKLQGAQGILNSIEVIKQQIQNNSIKLTQAQTFVQKLYNRAVGDGSKAMQGFRKALLLTGIGALIIGIGLLVENWDKLKGAILGTNKAQDLQNQTMKKAVEGIASELSASDKLKKTLNDESKTRKEKVEAVKKLQAEYPNLLGNIDAEKTSIQDINKALELNVQLLRIKAQQDAVNELRTEEFKNQINAQVDAQTDNNNTLLSWTLGLTNSELAQKSRTAQTNADINASKKQVEVLDELDASLEKQAKKLRESGATDTAVTVTKVNNSNSLADARKKANEDYNNMLLAQSELEEELRRLNLTQSELEEIAILDKFDSLVEKAGDSQELIKQINQQAEIELNKLFAKRRAEEDAIKKQADDLEIARKNELLDTIADIEEEHLTSSKDRELNEVNDKYFNLITLAEQYGENTVILEDARLKAIAEVEDKYRLESETKEKDTQQKRSDFFNAYAETVTNGLNSLNNLNDLVTTIQLSNAEGNEAKQEQIQRKSFERNKKIQIGIATIQGIQGVINSLTATSILPEPYASIQKGINAVAVATATASNIAKIKATSFGGGGGGTPSMGGGSVSAGASASSFSISDDTSSAQTNLNQNGTVNNGGVQKVIVTESDISQTQNSINAIEVKSTF